MCVCVYVCAYVRMCVCMCVYRNLVCVNNSFRNLPLLHVGLYVVKMYISCVSL